MNATKFEKVLVTGICILAAVLVILITVHMLDTQNTAAAATYGAVVQVERVTGGIPERADACHTYAMGNRFGGNESQNAVACAVTVALYEQYMSADAVSPVEASYVPNTPTVDDGDKPTEEPTVTDKPELPADDKPVKVDDGSKPDKKQKCNNGNGNGAEGCNASEHGNNDETGDKGDKADNRDTGHSDNDHGNGDHGNNGNGGSH